MLVMFESVYCMNENAYLADNLAIFCTSRIRLYVLEGLATKSIAFLSLTFFHDDVKMVGTIVRTMSVRI